MELSDAQQGLNAAVSLDPVAREAVQRFANCSYTHAQPLRCVANDDVEIICREYIDLVAASPLCRDMLRMSVDLACCANVGATAPTCRAIGGHEFSGSLQTVLAGFERTAD